MGRVTSGYAPVSVAVLSLVVQAWGIDRIAGIDYRLEEALVRRALEVGDHVTWNSEAGRVSGTIIKVHTKDVKFKGYTHHASEVEPQYEIKSDKTDHIAMHKRSALRRSRR